MMDAETELLTFFIFSIAMIFCIFMMLHRYCKSQDVSDFTATKNAGYFASEQDWIGHSIEGQNIGDVSNNDNIFIDGEYDAYYTYSRSAFGIKYWYKMNLRFNWNTHEINGNGQDILGRFVVTGLYSGVNGTYKIALKKRYIDKRHIVHVRVIYQDNKFVGVWHQKPWYYKKDSEIYLSKPFYYAKCGFKLPKSYQPNQMISNDHEREAFLLNMGNDVPHVL